MIKNHIYFFALLTLVHLISACQTPTNTDPIGFCSQDCTKKLVGTTPEYLIQIGKTRLSDVVPDSLRDRKVFGMDKNGNITSLSDMKHYIDFWTGKQGDTIIGARLAFDDAFSTTKGDLYDLTPIEIKKILGAPIQNYESSLSKGSVPISDLLVYEYRDLEIIFFLNKAHSISLGEVRSN